LSIQERIPQRVFEISFYSADAKNFSVVKAVLLALNFKATDFIEDDDLGKSVLKIYLNNKVDFTKTQNLFKKLSLKVKVTARILQPKDWASLWKKQWQPAPLTKTLDVVPVWCQKKYKRAKGRDYILMDTLLSFGTGLHETTQIVSQMIEDKKKDIKTLFDIGTGTGILGMVALKHGAKSVFAVDIGELSVEAAKNNFKVNKLKATVKKADINRFAHNKTYDFVAANLVTQDLIAAQNKITRFVKPGGYLAVSGISLLNCPVFEKGFNAKSFIKLETVKAKEWAGYLYQKKMS
jgi:ribosomal protein L11 methyltransferase